MLNKILICRDAAKIIFNQLSIRDHVNLAKTMPDKYVYYLHTSSLGGKERDFILIEIFDRIPLEKFKDSTL